MLFISHSTQDKMAALDLQRRLCERGYASDQHFLDSDQRSGIKLGDKWEKVIYDNLRDCRALLVLCSPNWLQSKWCFAELASAKMTGKQIFPVVLVDCDRSSLSEYQAVFVNQEKAADRELAFERLFQDLEARGLGPTDHLPWPNPELKDVYGQVDDCPFPGLPAFDQRYAAVYFGREREARVVLEELRQMRSKGEPRLLMIVGGSGSGKSSLLMAGVLPRLKHSTSGSDWLVLPTLRFGRRDDDDALFETLADEIVTRYPRDDAGNGAGVPDRKTLRNQFAAEDASQAAKAFLDAARDLTFACGVKDATVLLPVDQFEEFLAPSAEARADKFLNFLAQVYQHCNDRLLVIGTMRSDYLDVYERHTHALKAPKFHPWRLEPFPREQIENAILKPAARVNVEVAPELVERLKQQAPTADALPLLAFTLEKLYRKYAADKKLDLSEYEDLGGMEGSIRHTAGQIMPANTLPPAVESAVRLSFVKHLAQVNDKGEFVRLTASWMDLDPVAYNILEQFVSQRLLVKSKRDGEVVVEVAHEAIFRCWEPLAAWLRTSADIARWRRDVDRDRQSATANRRKWSGLTGPQLVLARDWPRTRREELGNDEVKWIRNAIRWSRVLMGTWITVGVIVASSAGVAWWQKGVADEKTAKATNAESKANESTAKAINAQKDALRQAAYLSWQRAFTERDNHQTIAAGLHFLAAARLFSDAGESDQALSSLHAIAGLHGTPVASFPTKIPITQTTNVLPIWTPFMSMQLSKDESRILIWGGNIVELWEVLTNRFLRRWERNGELRGASLSPDGSSVLIWGLDGTARLWDVGADQPVRQWKQKSTVFGASFSPDGSRVLTWGGAMVQLWGLGSDQPLRQWKHEGSVFGASFSPDGSRVLSWDGTAARLWGLGSDQPLRRWVHDQGGADDASFSRDGSRVLTWGADRTVRLWDVKSDQPLNQWKHDGVAVTASLSPDGSSVLTWCLDGHELKWGLDGTARLWRAGSNQPLQQWKHNGNVQHALFIRDGSRVLTWGADRTVRLWDVEPDQPLRQWKHDDGDRRRGLYHALLSPDGSRVLTWDNGGTARLWGVGSDQPLRRWQNEEAISGASFSSDGSRVLTWGSGGAARLWDVGSDQPLRLWKHGGVIRGASFSRAGVRVLTWGEGDMAQLWDVESDQPLRRWDHKDAVNGASFNQNDSRVVSWSKDNTVIWLWDVGSDQPLRQWKHDGEAEPASASADGSRVLTLGTDGTAKLWDIRIDESIPLAERTLEYTVRTATTLDSEGRPRALSLHEWERKREQLEKLRKER
jgi:WD40 repeat protein